MIAVASLVASTSGAVVWLGVAASLTVLHHPLYKGGGGVTGPELSHGPSLPGRGYSGGWGRY